MTERGSAAQRCYVELPRPGRARGRRAEGQVSTPHQTHVTNRFTMSGG